MEQKDNLTVAVGSELNMQVEGMEERFKALLIGLEPPLYLITRMQLPTKFRNQIDKGTDFIVRYLYLGNVFGFKTRSLGSVDSPYKVTFLTYPERVESLNIRNSRRVSCFIPATLTLAKRELKGLIADISKDGIGFTINAGTELLQEVKINDLVKISFPLLGIEGMHSFLGKIKNINNDLKSLSFGIQFESMKENVKDMIDTYVKDVLDLN